MDISQKLNERIDEAIDLQDDALKAMEGLSGKLDAMSESVSDMKKMLFEKKSGMPEMR